MRLFRSARWLLLALLVCLVPASSNAGVFISVNFGPPVLPVYVVPVCPQPNLIWMPGYWAYGDDGYFWVPGAWVPAPFVGGLWTPGYWGWSSGLYIYHPGYWGYHVGYYGGVNYGGGYLGIGFAGGEWRGGVFAYNTAVVNVNTTIIHTTYINRAIIQTNTIVNNNHVAYSGGPGGIQHTPTAQEQIAVHETHTPPTTFQTQHIQAAQSNKQSYAKANGGRPATLAVARPLPVETHPAPPVSRVSTAGSVRPAPAANVSHAPAAAPNRPALTQESRPAPQMHETPAPQMHETPAPAVHNPPPAVHNPPPAVHNPPPAPRPAEKPKPETHEKRE
ncbi:MAG: YXWGXW repeat-containing protein [Terracidiphilus sp.]